MRFTTHQFSTCHHDAFFKTVNLPAQIVVIRETLSVKNAKEKLERRRCFLNLLSDVRFLTRQGLPLRDDANDLDSNYHQLLKLRDEYNSRVIEWNERKTDKYTSPEMQNEIIREITSLLPNTTFCTIMVDDTSDISNREQVVVCLPWVGIDFEVYEEFIGLYFVDSIKSPTLFSVIKDVLQRLNLSLSKVRGQCYDGAAAMTLDTAYVIIKLIKYSPQREA